MKKGSRRLNYEDRKKIEQYLNKGENISAIANNIGFHRATIYKELKRGGTPYKAEVAQKNL